MSFLRALNPARNAVPLLNPLRRFSTTPFPQKTATEAAKDTLKNVDRTISDAAVKGIEKGEQAASTLKSSASLKSSQASGTAKEMSGEAKGKTSEMTGEAKGKAQEMAGEAKGKAQEIAGEAKGKAEEVKGKV